MFDDSIARQHHFYFGNLNQSEASDQHIPIQSSFKIRSDDEFSKEVTFDDFFRYLQAEAFI